MPKAKPLQENVHSENDTVKKEQTNEESVQQGLRKDTQKKQK